MVTQKPISLKIDTYLLRNLDKEVQIGFRKRNWHINQAIEIYLELQDLNRSLRDYQDPTIKRDAVERFLRHRCPNGASW